MSLDRCRLAVMAVVVGLLATAFGSGGAFSQMLSDKKPNVGVATAHVMPVQGIDVSFWQGDIKGKRENGGGVRSANKKGTEGGDRLDPKFLNNWRAAKQAGIARGAYHLMYWCRSAKEQASWFISHVPKDGDALPPV